MGIDFEKRINELEQKNRLITDNLVDAVWVFDVKSMTYEYITPSIEKISGYSRDELVGKAVESRMSKDSYHKILNILKEILNNKEGRTKPIKSLEVEMIHKNGSVYWVEVNAKFLNNKQFPYKMIGITRDITKRKKSQLKQEILIKKLKTTIEENEKLLKENKLLKKILPICSGCGRIRDEKKRWWPLEVYVAKFTKSNISHTICGDCKAVIYDNPDD